MAAGPEFVVDDRVRFIGTDTIQTIRRYDTEALEIKSSAVMMQPASRIIDTISGAICRGTVRVSAPYTSDALECEALDAAEMFHMLGYPESCEVLQGRLPKAAVRSSRQPV